MQIDDIEVFIFDFDGVLTDNKVFLNEKGEETVVCSRSDGLGFDVLRKLKKKILILSTEKNAVVKRRAEKLQVECINDAKDKEVSLKSYIAERNIDISKVFYVGNDLNDYNAMKLSRYSACPADSHPIIREISGFILASNGGNGVVREILEDLFNINFREFI